jgi:predicted DNA-binding transcriptional regulator YafY
MSEKIKTTETVIGTLLLLISNPGIKSREMARILGVSSRTVLRHVERLRSMGLQIESSTGPSGGLKARWQYCLRPLVFTGAEAVALFLAARVLTANEGFPYRENLLDALGKISKALITEQEKNFFKTLETKLSIAGNWSRDYLPWESQLGCLCEAARHRRVVEMVYDSASSEQVTLRRVRPYHVLLKEGAWYLVAFCHEREEVRTFRIDRIKSLNNTPDTFPDPGFNLEDYFKNSWQLGRGSPVQIKIQVYPPMARYVRENDWHPSQVKEVLSDGSIILSVTVEGTWEIKKWILGWGQYALVLEPETLRQEIADELEVLLQAYRSDAMIGHGEPGNYPSDAEKSLPELF